MKHSETFGEWLLAELRSRGFSIRSLSKVMNPEKPEVARRALNHYIHDGMLPSERNAEAICAALGIRRDVMPLEVAQRGVPFDADMEAVLERMFRRVLAEMLEPKGGVVRLGRNDRGFAGPVGRSLPPAQPKNATVGEAA